MERLTGPWKLSHLNSVKKNNYKVFSAFHCGGGSSMGYKLSGFDVLGGVEIDKEMMALYRANHNPKHSYLMGVEDFNKIERSKLPPELFNLDILDGSPPCSSFSMAGSREDGWGENKKFREGQSVQILDDLFFHFIETARKLQPKIVISENVKGMTMGKAKGYVKQINQMFNLAGYDTQLFLLNAAFMGVPQRRERVFFVSRRKDLKLPELRLNFNEKTISAQQAFNNINYSLEEKKFLTAARGSLWKQCKLGEYFSSVHPKGHDFQTYKAHPQKVLNTVVSSSANGPTYWDEPRWFTRLEFIRTQSFPDDYNFLNQEPKYVCGMSVPPFMMNRVSEQIKLQLLDSIKPLD